jgi:hypothetical protein
VSRLLLPTDHAEEQPPDQTRLAAWRSIALKWRKAIAIIPAAESAAGPVGQPACSITSWY